MKKIIINILFILLVITTILSVVSAEYYGMEESYTPIDGMRDMGDTRVTGKMETSKKMIKHKAENIIDIAKMKIDGNTLWVVQRDTSPNTLCKYDATDPGNITQVACVNLISTTVSGVDVDSRMVYVAGQDLEIYDKDTLTLQDNYTLPSRGRVIRVQNGYAYIATHNDSNIEVYDVINPTNIKAFKTIATTATTTRSVGLDFRDNYMFVVYFYDPDSDNVGTTQLAIFDVGKPSLPAEKKVIDFTSYTGGPPALALDDRYVYINMKEKFVIVDAKAPASAAEVGALTVSNAGVGIEVKGDVAYLPSSVNYTRLTLVDVSDRNAPAVMTTYDYSSLVNCDQAKYVYFGNASVYTSCLDTTTGDNHIEAFDLAKLETQVLKAGDISTTNMTVHRDAVVKGDLRVQGDTKVSTLSMMGNLWLYNPDEVAAFTMSDYQDTSRFSIDFNTTPLETSFRNDTGKTTMAFYNDGSSTAVFKLLSAGPVVPTGFYFRPAKRDGEPLAADCDANNELGRIDYNYTGHYLNVCRDTTNGWGVVDLQQDATDLRTIADTNGGVSDSTPATLTLEPTSEHVEIDCQDLDGCNITMGETNAYRRQKVDIVCTGTYACNFSDTAGVSELTGNISLGQYESLSLRYINDRWVQKGYETNKLLFVGADSQTTVKLKTPANVGIGFYTNGSSNPVFEATKANFLKVSGLFRKLKSDVTLSTTSFTPNRNSIHLTCSGNNLTKILGASSGLEVLILFKDACTVTDDDTGAADTININETFQTFAAGDTLRLYYDGISWFETGHSDNTP